jgi:hypothetical protein
MRSWLASHSDLHSIDSWKARLLKSTVDFALLPQNSTLGDFALTILAETGSNAWYFSLSCPLREFCGVGQDYYINRYYFCYMLSRCKLYCLYSHAETATSSSG